MNLQGSQFTRLGGRGSRKLLNAEGIVKGSEQLGGRSAVSGVASPGSQLREGPEDEAALLETGVRKLELGGPDDQLPDQQEVRVQDPGPPTRSPLGPPGAALHPLEPAQEIDRRTLRGQLGNRVHVPGLVRIAERLGPVERGAPQRSPAGQLTKGVLDLARRIGEVRADSDIG